MQIRYQEIVDIKEFEPKIQKLLDDHIIATPAQVVVEEVNINDPAALDKIISEDSVTAASKADRIASATKKTITENMDVDPALYTAFSRMLEDTIQAYRLKRISETEYLSKVKDIASDVANGRREDVPSSIAENIDAQAFYGALMPIVSAKAGPGENSQQTSAQIASDTRIILPNFGSFLGPYSLIGSDERCNWKNILSEY